MTTLNTTDHRSPDEIEQDILRTQDEMSQTVDRLGDRFTMRNLVDSLFERTGVDEVEARRMYDIARRNPLALGLISVGAIWLVSDADAKPSAFKSDSDDDYDTSGTYPLDTSHERDHRSYVQHMKAYERNPGEDELSYQRRRDDARATFLMVERRHDEDDKSFRDRLDDATEQMRSKRDEMAQQAREKRDQLAEQARQKKDELAEKFGHARDDAMDSMHDAQSKIGSQSRRAARKASNMYDDNPLIGGALAAFFGLVAGAAAPATRKERELIGDHAEQTLETAKKKATDVADTAKDEAKDVAETARKKKDEAVAKAESKVDPDKSGTTGSSKPASRRVGQPS